MKVRRENFEHNEPSTWTQLTNWATAGNLTIDLGEVVTCAATAISVNSHSQPGNATNTIITRRALYDPTERFATAIQGKKKEPIRLPTISAVLPSIHEHKASMLDRTMAPSRISVFGCYAVSQQ